MLRAVGSGFCLLGAALAFGAPQPYAADPHTLVLYHLDENSGSAMANSVAGLGGVFSSATSSPASPNPIVAATAFPGFGSALVKTRYDGVGVDVDASGTWNFEEVEAADRLPMALLGDQFTLEALVWLDAFPAASSQQIWGGDGTAQRAFQFRIDANSANLRFSPQPGTGTSLAFDLASVTGTHAPVAREWFHVAMSYDARGGPGTEVLRFYWTRLDSGAASANLVFTSAPGATSLNTSLSAPLVLGNEGRATGGMGEGLVGRIDEGRVSTIARAAHEFLFAPQTDTDGDGLPDTWETEHQLDPHDDGRTGESAPGAKDGPHGAVGDPDEDGFGNLEEYQARSDPRDPLSNPDDSDRDGLPDEWEQRWFGSLAATADGDPDGDSDSNATEQQLPTSPTDATSNRLDTDTDRLPDTWESAHFPDLTRNAGDDPDGDRFSNLQELAAATDPADPASRPAGTATRLVPIDDGDPLTSDFGHAGSSSINSAAFVRSALITHGNTQIVTWYGRHATDPAARFNNTIWIGRRTLGSARWEIFRHPSFTANNINDGHDVISSGIDGDGFLHLSWGMHGDAFHYARSLAPVTGTEAIVLGPDQTMTGRENSVTYPQFLTLPAGDLLYLFREGSSGNGDTYLNRYRTAPQAWENVHLAGTSQRPFLKGTGWNPNYNAYPTQPQLGGPDSDDLFLTWCWRYNSDSPAGESGYQTNNHYAFARSPDAGLSWQRSNGTPYTLPISRDGESGDPATAAEHIVQIPEGYSLINQTGMALDSRDHPVIASYWAPGTPNGNFRRQYQVVFRHDDGSWQTRQISHRVSDAIDDKVPESRLGDMRRPLVVVDGEDRIIVVFRHDEDARGFTVVHSLTRAADPGRTVWMQFHLSTENLGSTEPVIDHALWQRERRLHLLHQVAAGMDVPTPPNSASPVAVLEWDAAAYFRQPQPRITEDGGDYLIVCPSQPSWSYRLWSSSTLDAWQEVETRPGTGQPLVFRHTPVPGESARFWRIEMIPIPIIPQP
jgi:hypothetical protein